MPFGLDVHRCHSGIRLHGRRGLEASVGPPIAMTACRNRVLGAGSRMRRRWHVARLQELSGRGRSMAPGRGFDVSRRLSEPSLQPRFRGWSPEWGGVGTSRRLQAVAEWWKDNGTGQGCGLTVQAAHRQCQTEHRGCRLGAPALQARQANSRRGAPSPSALNGVLPPPFAGNDRRRSQTVRRWPGWTWRSSLLTATLAESVRLVSPFMPPLPPLS